MSWLSLQIWDVCYSAEHRCQVAVDALMGRFCGDRVCDSLNCELVRSWLWWALSRCLSTWERWVGKMQKEQENEQGGVAAVVEEEKTMATCYEFLNIV